ncbi:MAG: (d)CMP kinase [Peptococcaceae bacterium]|nr:(d)CMP kinase [Peptococcaceae bacterium]
MNKTTAIAVDGPAGAGKSTVARKVAEKLGFLYVDTGAMYRALTLFALRRGVPINNDEALSELIKQVRLDVKPGRILLNGEDVTVPIRSPEVSRHVSLVARLPSVRRYLLKLQRELAANVNVVMEGRDIGTVVLPEADKKFFITASVAERAKRRRQDLLTQGHDISVEKLEKEIAERDLLDSTRDIAPLKPASDAIFIDTTRMTIQEVVDRIVSEVQGNR